MCGEGPAHMSRYMSTDIPISFHEYMAPWLWKNVMFNSRFYLSFLCNCLQNSLAMSKWKLFLHQCVLFWRMHAILVASFLIRLWRNLTWGRLNKKEGKETYCISCTNLWNIIVHFINYQVIVCFLLLNLHFCEGNTIWEIPKMKKQWTFIHKLLFWLNLNSFCHITAKQHRRPLVAEASHHS